ncbi:hypothetical protein DL96DRAFT_841012 [Flagelloscypha sp. PMI_526]|nr:hypothetical protein DL96DRAFT_841012 [Flagelloscypha sp. PMI_526]
MLTKHIISGAIDLSSLTSIRCAGHISIQESLRVLETLHKHAPQISNLHFRMPVNYIAHSADDVPIEIRKYYAVFKIPHWTTLRRLSLGIWTLGITTLSITTLSVTGQPTPLEIVTRMVVFATRFLTSSLSNPYLFQCLELEIHDESLEPIPPPNGWPDMSLWFALDDALVHTPQALLVIQFVSRYSQARKSVENLTELCENGLPKLVERKGLLIREEIGSRNYWDDTDMTA